MEITANRYCRMFLPRWYGASRNGETGNGEMGNGEMGKPNQKKSLWSWNMPRL